VSITKNDLAIEIARKCNVDQKKVKQVIQLTLDSIIDVLVNEEHFELRNFGIFKVRIRKARKSRNPRTGAAVLVPARKAVVFKAGKALAAKFGPGQPAGNNESAPAGALE